MGVDFIVLCFTIAALLRQELHSGLWKLLFKDGLVYFCITFLCNAVPAVSTTHVGLITDVFDEPFFCTTDFKRAKPQQ